MRSIQIKRRENGNFIRAQICTLPGHRLYPFFRRYVQLEGDNTEYEMVSSFQCPYLLELRHPDKASITACAASDDGEGRMQVVEGEFLLQVGCAKTCAHICAYKKSGIRLIQEVSRDISPELSQVSKQADTIALNQEFLAELRKVLNGVLK